MGSATLRRAILYTPRWTWRFDRSISCQPTRPISHSVSHAPTSSFGIAFDIDGVLLQGGKPIEGAAQALRKLYRDVDSPSHSQIPFIFLTNGGGVREFVKAAELSNLLGVNVLPQQVLLGHTLFKSLVDRFYVMCYARGVLLEEELVGNLQSSSQLTTSNIRIGGSPLVYTSFGKPDVAVFRSAEQALQRVVETLKSSHQNVIAADQNDNPGRINLRSSSAKCVGFKNIYMIGDNPATDIQGARQAGSPWFTILTRTGCFKGKENDALHPADLVVEGVQDAVDFILKKHDTADLSQV